MESFFVSSLVLETLFDMKGFVFSLLVLNRTMYRFVFTIE